MDDPKPNTLSPAEAEEFCAGEDARTGVSGAEPEEPNSLTLTPLDITRLRAAFAAHEDKQHCCAGVDVPEAGGRVHAADCPHRTSPSRSGGECGAGAAPRLRESAGAVGEFGEPWARRSPSTLWNRDGNVVFDACWTSLTLQDEQRYLQRVQAASWRGFLAELSDYRTGGAR